MNVVMSMNVWFMWMWWWVWMWWMWWEQILLKWKINFSVCTRWHWLININVNGLSLNRRAYHTNVRMCVCVIVWSVYVMIVNVFLSICVICVMCGEVMTYLRAHPWLSSETLRENIRNERKFMQSCILKNEWKTNEKRMKNEWKTNEKQMKKEWGKKKKNTHKFGVHWPARETQ